MSLDMNCHLYLEFMNKIIDNLYESIFVIGINAISNSK